MTEAGRHRWQQGLAAAWGLAVLALAVGLWQFLRAPALDTDVLALLPTEQRDARIAQAAEAVAGQGTGELLFLLRSSDAAAARQAAAVLRGVLHERHLPLEELVAALPAAGALDVLRPWQRGLVAEALREPLRSRPAEDWAEAALARLYSPLAFAPGPGVLEDPLGLASAWWQARARGLSFTQGEWQRSFADGSEAVLLRFRHAGGAFRVDGGSPLAGAVAEARERIAALDGAPVALLAAGVPLIAEAAAAQAAAEMNTIGLGSLLAVVLLVALCFRSPLPVLLVGSSLLVGVGAALVVTGWVFGEVHVLTLVFGASLVGVAEDYGIHYFAARQGDPARPGIAQLDHLLPGLLLALATSVLAYAAIGLAPFPGLRQMALFSAVGLLAAFLTVACWFPLWPKRAPAPSGLSRRVSQSLAAWPRLGGGGWASRRFAPALLLGTLAIAIAGLLQLRADDQLRALQGVPAGMLEEQQALARLLDLPSPAQFFLVEATDTEALLQREEALIEGLRRLRHEGLLSGWQALAEAVPSAQRQREDREVVAALESAVRQRLGEALGQPLPAPAADAADGPEAALGLHDWLASPLSQAERPLWLGEQEGRVASLVRVSGIGPESLPALAALAGEGVRWVDRSAEYSELLARYRVQIQGWLALGVAGVALLLWLRFGRRAWRALLPTLLAGALALGVQGLLGEPLQLFNVLALMLLLGVGIDYGIFLLEHQDDGASWLAVSLGAASTLLAFGLLALSQTPALHGFGLTMLVGVGAVWALSPLFRPPPRDAALLLRSRDPFHAS